MSLLDPRQKTISLKVVYYGPGLGGKTTSLKQIHRVIDPEGRVKLVSLDTDEDRTLFFDFLPIELGLVGRFKIKIQGFTVPGQVKYNMTRRYVLTGADGIVFVADSDPSRVVENVESLINLGDNLRAHGLNVNNIPLVFQYNKQDLSTSVSPGELEEKLNFRKVPGFATVATRGDGVFDAFVAVSKLMVSRVIKTYNLKQEQADEERILREVENRLRSLGSEDVVAPAVASFNREASMPAPAVAAPPAAPAPAPAAPAAPDATEREADEFFGSFTVGSPEPAPAEALPPLVARTETPNPIAQPVAAAAPSPAPASPTPASQMEAHVPAPAPAGPTPLPTPEPVAALPIAPAEPLEAPSAIESPPAAPPVIESTPVAPPMAVMAEGPSAAPPMAAMAESPSAAPPMAVMAEAGPAPAPAPESTTAVEEPARVTPSPVGAPRRAAPTPAPRDPAGLRNLLRSLREIGRGLAAGASLDQSATVILSSACQALEAVGGSLLVLNRDSGRLEGRFTSGYRSDPLLLAGEATGEQLLGLLQSGGDQLIVSEEQNADLHRQLATVSADVESTVVVPLVIGDEVEGALCVYLDEPLDLLDRKDALKALMVLAYQAAVGLRMSGLS